MNEELIEAVISAEREVVEGEVRAAPEFYDIGESDRATAFEEATKMRKLEAALDPQGLNTTAKRVLALINAGRS